MNDAQKKFLKDWTEPCESGVFKGMTSLDFLRQEIAEKEAEFRNEVALYGDAGPRAGLRLRQAKEQLARIERTIKKLEAQQ